MSNFDPRDLSAEHFLPRLRTPDLGTPEPPVNPADEILRSLTPAPLCLARCELCHHCRGAGRLPVTPWRDKEIECYECSGTGLHCPYQVAWGYCNENTRRFLTFAEALEFRDARGDGSICNLDGVDVSDDCDETGHYGTTDGLTEEERERLW